MSTPFPEAARGMRFPELQRSYEELREKVVDLEEDGTRAVREGSRRFVKERRCFQAQKQKLESENAALREALDRMNVDGPTVSFAANPYKAMVAVPERKEHQPSLCRDGWNPSENLVDGFCTPER